MVTGKTVGGLLLYPERNRLDRTQALRLYTEGSAWFSSEEGRKGRIAAGQYADLAVLNKDYFSVPEDDIRNIESVLTMVGGRPVWASEEFRRFDPPLPPASPDWSPVRSCCGYRVGASAAASGMQMRDARACCLHGHAHRYARHADIPASDLRSFWGVLGCSCFAF